jgi:hypothetical protein
MKYTIAIDTAADLLAACVPDGNKWLLVRETNEYTQQSSPDHTPTFQIIPGLVLTDEEPADETRIVWRGHERGWLTNTDGETFQYAIRAQ